MSTQLGLAQLVDRSESLLRSVEAGRMEMSPKFARALSKMTGVDPDWLMKPSVDSSPIPSVDGSPLELGMVIARIKSETERNINNAERDLAEAAKLQAETASTATDPMVPMVPMERRMAVVMSKLVEDALFDSLTRGETQLMDEITKLLCHRSSPGLPVSLGSCD